MNPIVPFIMAVGAILFIVGISVLTRHGFKKSVTVKFFRKEYGFRRFVFATITSGIAIIMVSIYIQKLFPVEAFQDEVKAPLATLSSNLKYELESILSHDESNTKMMNAIDRFQKEYQQALEKGDKNTMELLILEMESLREHR